MLELRHVSKLYSGIPAVQDVSFVARAGEVTGYLGPNGSGKSTPLKMIVGLIQPSGGHILFRGEAIDQDRIAYKQRLGYVPEEPHLYPHLTGAEYLEMVGQLRGMPQKLLAGKVEGFLKLLALHDDRYVPISSYSKGMRQKVLLAAAWGYEEFLIATTMAIVGVLAVIAWNSLLPDRRDSLVPSPCRHRRRNHRCG